jgi:hypothetical protein
MITLDEFIKKWTGVGIDFDGAYGFQCVDLYRQYVKECLGIPQTPAVSGAKDIWNNCPGFEKILNTPDGVPQKGDIMIWGSSYGPYGHVAVVTEATVNTFKCFSQNDPSGALPTIKWYKTYTPVIGWLRAIMPEDITKIKADLAEQRQQVSNLQTQVNGLLADIKAWEAKYNECNTQRIEATSSSDGFRRQLNDFVAQLATKLGTRQEVPEILASVDTLITYEDKASELERRLAKEESDHQQAISALEGKIATLEANLETLKADLKAVKDTAITPVQINSIWSTIISMFKRR